MAGLAHAGLLEVSPAGGGLLDSVPAAIVLRFSEPVTPAGRAVVVVSPAGRIVGGPARRLGPDRLTVPIASDEMGTYRVSWTVVSDDSHPARGGFTFSVGFAGPPPPDTEPAAVGGTTVAGFALQTVARAAGLAGMVLALALSAALLLGGAPPAKLRRTVAAGVVLLALAVPLSLLAQLASLAASGDGAPAVTDVLASSFGRVLALRAGVAVGAWSLLGAGGRARLGLALMTAGAAAVEGLSAHRLGGLSQAASIAIAGVHVLGAVLWTGSLVALLGGAPGPARLRRLAGGALAASGITLLVLHLGPSPILWLSTPYGALLVAKVLLAGLLAPAAARLGPAVGWSFRAQGLAAMAVMVLAAAVLSLQPPR